MQNKTNFRIIRSPRRKHPAFRIAEDGVLDVMVTKRYTSAMVKQLIDLNQEIIARLFSRIPQIKRHDFSDGSQFMFLGQPYPLHLTGRLRLFNSGFFIPRGEKDNIKSALITTYKELAHNIISKRMPHFQQLTGLSPDRIRITSAENRWGSCSSRRTISFSWKLIQCPPETIDYVIVHELSHLKEMNHSPAFWKLVAEILPDWRQRRKQLKDFSRKLPKWD